MIIYAIRQKSTGFYLPYIKKSRGFTSTVPTGKGIPRLFTRKGAATNALRCWLQGEWVARYNTSGLDSYGDYDIKVTPVFGRVCEDMEIVRILLLHFGACDENNYLWQSKV